MSANLELKRLQSILQRTLSNLKKLGVPSEPRDIDKTIKKINSLIALTKKITTLTNQLKDTPK